MIKGYAIAYTCIAVVLLGVFAISQILQLLQYNVVPNVTPTPGNNPSLSQHNEDIPVADASNKRTLYFNTVDSKVSDKAIITGHFWQELTDKELKAIFPGLARSYSITATANFSIDKGKVSLFNIEAHAVSAAGLKAYIRLAPGEIALDYRFDTEAKLTDILGTAVTACYFESRPDSKDLNNIFYFAYFKLPDIAYYVELSGSEADKEVLKDELFQLIVLLIEGGAADLSILNPVIPELREDWLELDEAYVDLDFGLYLPATLPKGFVFESALRFINQERNELNVYWTKDMGYIDWRVSYLDDNDKARITSVADRKNYDLSLYSIPSAESVPVDLREIVENPTFLIEELTLDTIRSRSYEISDSGDQPGTRMRFSVLYGNVLVEISVKGATPEAIFDMLSKLKLIRTD